VDVVILDEGRGVIPLRDRGIDRARALPHSTAMYVIAEKYVEVHGAGWGGNGVGGRTYSMPEPEWNEQRSIANIPSGVVTSRLCWKHRDIAHR